MLPVRKLLNKSLRTSGGRRVGHTTAGKEKHHKGTPVLAQRFDGPHSGPNAYVSTRIWCTHTRVQRLYIDVIFVAQESAPKAFGSFPAILLRGAYITQLLLKRPETQSAEQLHFHVPIEIESTVPGGVGRMAGVPTYACAGIAQHNLARSASSSTGRHRRRDLTHRLVREQGTSENRARGQGRRGAYRTALARCAVLHAHAPKWCKRRKAEPQTSAASASRAAHAATHAS
jgi:hypothetical protein